MYQMPNDLWPIFLLLQYLVLGLRSNFTWVIFSFTTPGWNRNSELVVEARGLQFDSRQVQAILLFSRTRTLDLGPTRLMNTEATFAGVRPLLFAKYCSPPCISEVTYEWIYTSTPQLVCFACGANLHSYNCTDLVEHRQDFQTKSRCVIILI